MGGGSGGDHSEEEADESQEYEQAHNEIAPPGQLILNRHESQTDPFGKQPVSKLLRGDETDPALRARGNEAIHDDPPQGFADERLQPARQSQAFAGSSGPLLDQGFVLRAYAV